MRKLNRHNNIWEHMLLRFDIKARHEFRHFKFFLKWLILAMTIGIICGISGSAFHYVTTFTEIFFIEHSLLILLLPISGAIIVAIYRLFHIYNDEGTNSILRAARAESDSALRVAPLIFVSTCLTQICGGSAGREGAALQIGGSVGSFMGRKLKLSKSEIQLLVMCGMSATFCALFGAPLSAALFSIEVAGVGTVFFAGLVPSVIASIIAMMIAQGLGVHGFDFIHAAAQSYELTNFAKVLLFAAMCAYLSIIYCSAIHHAMRFYTSVFKNPYVRICAGAFIVILLSLIFHSTEYNCAGIPVIYKALSGEASPFAFILKLILTAATIGCGFKGGEIIPTLFIGSTFGCAIAPFFGLDPVFAAEIGLIAMFCGAVNCPLTSLLLSVELFGCENFIFFGLAGAVSYMLSGYYSLYSGQKFMNSKLVPVPFEKSANK